MFIRMEGWKWTEGKGKSVMNSVGNVISSGMIINDDERSNSMSDHTEGNVIENQMCTKSSQLK